MKDRIVQFLVSEKISPAEFADKIGVQRSSMSHILNGRNHPSASFLQKMLQVYPMLNPRWLMIGDGEMNIPIPDKAALSSDIQVGSLAESIPSVSIVDNIQFNHPEVPELAKELKNNNEVRNQATVEEDRLSTPLSSEMKTAQENQVKAESSYAKPKPTASFSVTSEENREIEQILFFHTDKTFTVYKPS